MSYTADEATKDRDRYFKALSSMDGHTTAFVIERKYQLDGYPPEIVGVALNAAANGDDMYEAIDRHLGVYDDELDPTP